jgi:hypothetical protein
MDACASVLLGFPPEDGEAPLSNEEYDRAARAHVARLGTLFKEQAKLLAAHAYALLQVSDGSTLPPPSRVLYRKLGRSCVAAEK